MPDNTNGLAVLVTDPSSSRVGQLARMVAEEIFTDRMVEVEFVDGERRRFPFDDGVIEVFYRHNDSLGVASDALCGRGPHSLNNRYASVSGKSQEQFSSAYQRLFGEDFVGYGL